MRGNPFTKKSNAILAIAAAAIGFVAGQLNTGNAERIVVTSLQATYSLAKSLTRQTDIRIHPVIPPGISMERQKQYLKKHAHQLKPLFNQATAIVSIRYTWPGDPVFPQARGTNIRLIEIDASMPFDPMQSGVSLRKKPLSGAQRKPKAANISPYIWLSTTNFLKSANIVAADLASLFPDQAMRIEQNLIALKHEVLKLKSDYETRLAELESLEVIALSDDFVYLTENLNIDVVSYYLKPEIHWTNTDVLSLAQDIQTNHITVVIHKWNPDQRIRQVIERAGAELVILKTIDPSLKTNTSHDPDEYLKLMEYNLAILYQGLHRRQSQPDESS